VTERDRALLRILIAVACAGAAVLAVLVLTSSGGGETAGRVVGTALALAVFSLAGMTGAQLAARRPEISVIGYLTAIAAVAGFALILDLIWSGDLFGAGDPRLLGYLLLVTLAASQCSLLLGHAHPEDGQAVRLLRAATLLAIGVLAIMGITEIAESGQQVGPKPFALAALVYLLGVTLVPLLGLLEAASLPAIRGGDPEVDPPPALRIDHVVIAVSDWQRSGAFYRDVLGARIVSSPGGRTAYAIGQQQLKVHGPGTRAEPLPAHPVQPGNSDLCFVWSGPIEAALEHLRRHGVAVSEGPVVRSGASGAGRSVYFSDPDGSLIELISYAPEEPPGAARIT
jgi:catechol 2,3-dioxygenase-like lactoylglutathione lyase family enzyme